MKQLGRRKFRLVEGDDTLVSFGGGKTAQMMWNRKRLL